MTADDANLDATFEFLSHSEADTERLAAALADTAPPGTVVSLTGTLGAGKTRFVQAVAAACGVQPGAVLSPTFVLCQTYHGRRLLHHFDAYRIADDDEFLELGPEEQFESSALTFVEWGDRVRRCLPAQRWEIQIDVTGDTQRRFTLRAVGAGLAEALARLRRAVEREKGRKGEEEKGRRGDGEIREKGQADPPEFPS